MKLKTRISALVIAFFIIILLVCFGTWFYAKSENWTHTESFYFTVMTITTVGYGDYVPSHDLSKIVTAIYGLISIPIVLFIFGVMAENYFESKVRGLEYRLKRIMSQEEEIEEAIEKTEDKVEAGLNNRLS